MQTETEVSNTKNEASHREAELYLATMQSLASELDRAMAAITNRCLPTLEDSIYRQSATCAQLKKMPGHALLRRPKDRGAAAAFNPAPDTTPLDAELAGRISAASASLLSLNKRYSALLQHSSDTLRLFAGLFRPYPGQSQSGGIMSTSLPTWSCEL